MKLPRPGAASMRRGIKLPLDWLFRIGRKPAKIEPKPGGGRCVCSCGYSEAEALRPGVSCVARKCSCCSRTLLRQRGDAQSDLTIVEAFGGLAWAMAGLRRQMAIHAEGCVRVAAAVSAFVEMTAWRSVRAAIEAERAFALPTRGRRYRRGIRRAGRLQAS